jgi:hypothetical protein
MTNQEAQASEVKDIRVLCTHLFESRNHCASPALRGETFCYYHDPTRLRPETRAARRLARRNFCIPAPATHEQSLEAITIILHAILDDRVKLTKARRILYSLQQLSQTFQEGSSQV